jgi:hypothetical protein
MKQHAKTLIFSTKTPIHSYKHRSTNMTNHQNHSKLKNKHDTKQLLDVHMILTWVRQTTEQRGTQKLDSDEQGNISLNKVLSIKGSSSHYRINHLTQNKHNLHGWRQLSQHHV